MSSYYAKKLRCVRLFTLTGCSETGGGGPEAACPRPLPASLQSVGVTPCLRDIDRVCSEAARCLSDTDRCVGLEFRRALIFSSAGSLNWQYNWSKARPVCLCVCLCVCLSVCVLTRVAQFITETRS